MEFHEKLRELRKNRGMTQEELAEALFVSRTAISKWESGRGYPGIDSLKEIAKFFSVTIDELLSAEKLVTIAQEENKNNIREICGLLSGGIDLLAFLLIVLPLYPDPADGFIYSVNLPAYTGTTPLIRSIHWIIFSLLMLTGAVKIMLMKWNADKGISILTGISMGLGILTVFFLAIVREAYATTVAFILLIIKEFLLVRSIKAETGIKSSREQ